MCELKHFIQTMLPSVNTTGKCHHLNYNGSSKALVINKDAGTTLSEKDLKWCGLSSYSQVLRWSQGVVTDIPSESKLRMLIFMIMHFYRVINLKWFTAFFPETVKSILKYQALYQGRVMLSVLNVLWCSAIHHWSQVTFQVDTFQIITLLLITAKEIWRRNWMGYLPWPTTDIEKDFFFLINGPDKNLFKKNNFSMSVVGHGRYPYQIVHQHDLMELGVQSKLLFCSFGGVEHISIFGSVSAGWINNSSVTDVGKESQGKAQLLHFHFATV